MSDEQWTELDACVTAADLLDASKRENRCPYTLKGYCCSYHEGFADGTAMLIERMFPYE